MGATKIYIHTHTHTYTHAYIYVRGYGSCFGHAWRARWNVLIRSWLLTRFQYRKSRSERNDVSDDRMSRFAGTPEARLRIHVCICLFLITLLCHSRLADCVSSSSNRSRNAMRSTADFTTISRFSVPLCLRSVDISLILFIDYVMRVWWVRKWFMSRRSAAPLRNRPMLQGPFKPRISIATSSYRIESADPRGKNPRTICARARLESNESKAVALRMNRVSTELIVARISRSEWIIGTAYRKNFSIIVS